jgi:hypothetical protein
VDKAARGGSDAQKVLSEAGLNQVDIQTAVHDREEYSLYGNKRRVRENVKTNHYRREHARDGNPCER